MRPNSPYLIDQNYVLDIAHIEMPICPPNSMSRDVWASKYKWKDEATLEDSCVRVCEGVYKNDTESHKLQALDAMQAGLWMPAGRILAGAGTTKRVTLMNCYVNGILQDSMESIIEGVKNTMLTTQQGGGMGTAFGTLRPENALLLRTHSKASGPIPFMIGQDGEVRAVRSAGDRRGAQMYTITDTHPDLMAFIKVKQQPGVLTTANISILVTDAFMEAVREDEDWLLYFSVPTWHKRSGDLEALDFVDEETGIQQYVYSVWKARDLWAEITKATYEYSEPGVLFIDRINDLNNLSYCEEITCTNPCGEQPLPPHGTCNLGAVNLARMVRKPFTAQASFNWALLRRITQIGTRFLDNVIDVTGYPLPEQEQEELNKRRLGLGITGLADALAQLGFRYGDAKSGDFAEQMMETICETAYGASIELSKERGCFPMLDLDGYLAPNTFAGQRLHSSVHAAIRKDGIRNSLLLTNAPTGTTSVTYGDVSSGLEPVFAHSSKRKVRQERDDEWKEYVTVGYGARLFYKLYGDKTPLPRHMVQTADLTVEEHVFMQARIQKWVDASCSKTVNIPESMPYDQFVKVYDLAYNWGCKGCTTYRPSKVRGSILIDTSIPSAGDTTLIPATRPQRLSGYTDKIKWPQRSSALYLTINFLNDKPFEVMINSKDARDAEWTMALSLMITGILRKGGDVSFIAEELQQIQSIYNFAFIDGKRYGSLPAYIGSILGPLLTGTNEAPLAITNQAEAETIVTGDFCPECHQPTLIKESACEKCTNCTYSKC